jgi:hypothetical protein
VGRRTRGKKEFGAKRDSFFVLNLKRGQFKDNFGAKKDERTKDIKNLSVEMVY